MESLGLRLRKIMLGLGYRQGHSAQKICINRSHFNQILSDEIRPSSLTLIAILNHLGVDLMKILDERIAELSGHTAPRFFAERLVSGINELSPLKQRIVYKTIIGILDDSSTFSHQELVSEMRQRTKTIKTNEMGC